MGVEFLEAKQITEIKESKNTLPTGETKKKKQQQQQKYQPDPRYMVGKLNILKEKQHKTQKTKNKNKTKKKKKENLTHLWDLKTK